MSFILSGTFAECHCAGCRYAECRYAECRYAECRYAECHCAGCRYAECHGASLGVFYMLGSDLLLQVIGPLAMLCILQCRLARRQTGASLKVVFYFKLGCFCHECNCMADSRKL